MAETYLNLVIGFITVRLPVVEPSKSMRPGRGRICRIRRGRGRMRTARVALLFSLVVVGQMAGVILRPVYAQTRVLENPQAGSFQSGIGVISGWACNATVIEIVIDNGSALQAGYGTTREDTHVSCGDANNGF